MTLLQIQRRLLQVRRLIREILGAGDQTYVWHRQGQYRDLWRACAEELGATFKELDDALWEVRLGERSVRISNDILPLDDPVTLEIAGRKPLVYRLLREHGLPVPDHLSFKLEELSKASDFCNRYPDGCVVKPAAGTSSGRGVTTHIKASTELRSASLLASLFGSELLIEPMISGESFRVLVLNGEAIHAVCRRGPRVTGDGGLTLEELIEKEYERLRKAGQDGWRIDEDSLFSLEYQGHTLKSIPAAGEVVVINSTNNPRLRKSELRTVYNANVLDEIHPSILRQAEKAAEILGSRFVGVDFICRDATVPLEQSGGAFNELNTTPGMHHHYDSESHRYPKPALRALASLLDQGNAHPGNPQAEASPPPTHEKPA